MKPTKLLSALAVLTAVAASHIPNMRDILIRQNTLSPVGKYSDGFDARDWVKVELNSPRLMRVVTGDRVEMECEAIGSPPPSVQWLRGLHPLTQGFEESNSIGGVGLGKIKSRLVLDCIMPHHQGVYTCVAISGAETITSVPATLLIQGGNVTSLLSVCPPGMSKPPRIVTWSSITMETISNDATLPCVVDGNPQPQIYWVDKDNHIIESQANSRYKVMESGELVISKLRWSDMGGYACVAQNHLGRDTITTFVYPILDE